MNHLSLELIPIGNEGTAHCQDYNLEQLCAAVIYRTANEWEKSALDIKWSATEKVFTVEFKATGDISIPLSEALSKRIPLQVAEASRCECGATLTLGDYRVRIEESDFTFCAEYFCQRCKARATADKKGIRSLIENWFRGLKKIEIKATGVGIEREPK